MDRIHPPRKKWILAAGRSLLRFPCFPIVHAQAGETVIDRVLDLGLMVCGLVILRRRMAARAAVVVFGAIWFFDLTEGIFAIQRYNCGHPLSRSRQAEFACFVLLLATVCGVALAPKLPRIEAVTWQEEVTAIRGFLAEILHGAGPSQGACDPSRQRCLMTSNDGLDYGPESW